MLRGLETAPWTNQYASFPGGLWTCAAELVASRLLGSGEASLRTTNVHVVFLRGGRTSRVELRARFLRQGRALGLVEVDGVDEDGRLCIRASVTGQAGDRAPVPFATK